MPRAPKGRYGGVHADRWSLVLRPAPEGRGRWEGEGPRTLVLRPFRCAGPLGLAAPGGLARSGQGGPGRSNAARASETGREARSRRNMTATPRRATAQDVPQVTRILVDAFADDPMWGAWAFPDPVTRRRSREQVFRLLVEGATRYPHVWISPDGAATAVWIPPGGTE